MVWYSVSSKNEDIKFIQIRYTDVPGMVLSKISCKALMYICQLVLSISYPMRRIDYNIRSFI
jgi:hypothetical protein